MVDVKNIISGNKDFDINLEFIHVHEDSDIRGNERYDFVLNILIAYNLC